MNKCWKREKKNTHILKCVNDWNYENSFFFSFSLFTKNRRQYLHRKKKFLIFKVVFSLPFGIIHGKFQAQSERKIKMWNKWMSISLKCNVQKLLKNFLQHCLFRNEWIKKHKEKKKTICTRNQEKDQMNLRRPTKNYSIFSSPSETSLIPFFITHTLSRMQEQYSSITSKSFFVFQP